MRRVNFYMPDELYDWFERRSEQQNVSVAELLRRASQYWMEIKSHPIEQLLEAEDPDAVLQGVNAARKPFGVELREKLDRIEYLLKKNTPQEVWDEIEREGREWVATGALPTVRKTPMEERE